MIPLGTIALDDATRGQLTWDGNRIRCDGVIVDAVPAASSHVDAIRIAGQVWAGRDWDLQLAAEAPSVLLRALIAASGLSARQYAMQVLARDERTLRRWLAGDSPIPAAVLRWMLNRLNPGLDTSQATR